jgi:hypothetical protein
MTYTLADIHPAANNLAKSDWSDDPYFDGMIDDVQIYNYARTTEQIAQDYLDVKGDWICNRELTPLDYDFNENCRVDLADFALFAEQWLKNNRIYPR